MNIPPNDADPPGGIRRLLHDVNDELSVAVLELELLLEANRLDDASGKAVAGSLEACRRAASRLKGVWRALEPSGDAG
jgi:hypothetical protein